jgi:hypothetical protein
VSTQGDDDAHPMGGEDDTPPDNINLSLAGVDDAEENAETEDNADDIENENNEKMKSKTKLKKMRKKTKLKLTRRTATTNLKRYPRVISKTTRTQERMQLQEWTTIHRW